MKKYLLALVFLILSNLGLLGQTWTGNIDSSWDKAGNWSTNSVPGPASSVTIPGGLVNHPVLTAATTLNSLSFSPGSQLDFNGHSLTLNNLINLQGGTLTNSGNGPINIVVNGGTSTLRESEIQGDLVIQINGNAAFQEANTGGPNVFNGNVTYKMASTGTFTISNNFRSLYKGSLIVERTVAGATNIFTAGTTPSIIVEGDFSYINPVGGATTIGHTSEKSIILGNVNIDYNSAENYPTFILRCIDNFQGESEGVISIENPGSLQILRDTLKLKEFRVVGKRGASTADFDYNDFAVTDGFWYEDAPPVGDMAGNNQPLYFSRTRLVGPSHFISRGSANFHETVSGRGPNHFIGDVSFTADSTGAMYISQNFGSIFDGNLTVTRHRAGITSFFKAGENQVIRGDLKFVNKYGGTTDFGGNDGLVQIGGKVDIDYESLNGNPGFNLNRLKNLTGGGVISILNPGGIIVRYDTLIVQQFSIKGKKDGGIADFDLNDFTVTEGFWYEDAPPVDDEDGNSVTLIFSRTRVVGPSYFTSRGSASFNENYSGRGPNHFIGDVSFTADSTGALHISKYFGSTFDGNLTVTRNMAGITEFFLAGQNQAITGDLRYVNKHGGKTTIGGSSGMIQIGGKVDLDYESFNGYPEFQLNRLKNLTGGGVISILNPGKLTVMYDTLMLNQFIVKGKKNGGLSDFDFNDLTVTGGLWHEDAPPLGNEEGNSSHLFFSRTRVVGSSEFVSRGNASLYDTYSGRGPNHFIGDVTFRADSTGPIYISSYFGSTFEGNLTIMRNKAGITEAFRNANSQEITGDFNYINKHGGHSSMGTFGGVTLIGGKVNVDYESHVEYAPFGFSRIKNLTGGGIISIKNAGRTIMEMDTLLLESFSIVGVNGPAVSDIDRNFITTSTGFLFEDDPNHQNDVYFSRNTVRGPAVIRMKGEGVFFDTYSGRGENFYGANVTYEVVGEGEIRIGHYFPVHYFGNLTFASVEGINPFNDRIYFRGENNATFLHNGVEEGVLPGFRINKENDARLILSQPLVNTQKIEFFGGYIESSPTYPLIFGLGSSHEGMSDDSHVIGPVHKIGNTAFTFPLGTGSKLFQAAMSAPNDMNAHFSVQFLERNPATDGYDTQSKEEVITRVYHEGYWDIQRLSGENGVELTFGYQVPPGYVNDPSKLVVVHWDGSKWNDLGNGGTTGDNEIGTVSTMFSVNEFSPFTFASIEDANPLPVELISFQIGKESGSTVLNWVTSEEVNSAYFQIERSLNSSNWEVIGEVKAAGTSKYIRGYQFSDSDRIFAELIFYRLKMIDHDGSLTYSEIRSIAGELVGERLVYPNPATDHLKFDLAPEQLVELKIFNVAGIEHPVRTQVGDQGSILDVSQLREGIYILRVTTKSKAIHTLRFIIRR